jgi:hypothetical protein
VPDEEITREKNTRDTGTRNKGARDKGAREIDECRKILERICADAGESIDSPFCREVAMHLEKCENCRAQADALRGTVRLYRCLERDDVPLTVAQNLRRALGLTEPPPPQSQR